jgi:hypothetical protein
VRRGTRGREVADGLAAALADDIGLARA